MNKVDRGYQKTSYPAIVVCEWPLIRITPQGKTFSNLEIQKRKKRDTHSK